MNIRALRGGCDHQRGLAMKGSRRFTIALAAAVSCATAASAQTSAGATFEGLIVDSISGEPIEGVLVRMDAGAEAFTDELGEFRITGLPEGRRLFALLSSDCRITWGRIDVSEGTAAQARLRLPPAFGAAAERKDREEAQRQRMGGKRYEAAEIDRMNARTVTELIRRVAPNMVTSMSGEPGGSTSIRSGRVRSLASGEPVLVMDGVRVPNAGAVLSSLLASEVEVLELLPGAAAGWAYGSSGADGVIRITLRKGAATGTPVDRDAAECVVPEFPRR